MDVGLPGPEFLGDLGLFAVAAVVEPRRVGEQVGHAVKGLGEADGDLQGGHPSAEGRLQLGQDRVEVCVFPVQFVDEQHSGEGTLGGFPPEAYRGVVEAAGGIDHEDG